MTFTPTNIFNYYFATIGITTIFRCKNSKKTVDSLSKQESVGSLNLNRSYKSECLMEEIRIRCQTPGPTTDDNTVCLRSFANLSTSVLYRPLCHLAHHPGHTREGADFMS